MKYTKDQVMKFLPHRSPFLFIDTIEDIILPEGVRVDDLEKNNYKNLIGGRVIAHFEVRSDLEILRGHFPGNPIFPGVTQIEMMAQACAFMSSECLQGNFNNINLEVIFLSNSNTKFRKKVVPGTKLRIETLMESSRGTIQTHRASCYDEEGLVSETKITASLKYIDKDER